MAHAYDFYKPNLASEYPVIIPNSILHMAFFHIYCWHEHHILAVLFFILFTFSSSWLYCFFTFWWQIHDYRIWILPVLFTCFSINKIRYLVIQIACWSDSYLSSTVIVAGSWWEAFSNMLSHGSWFLLQTIV